MSPIEEDPLAVARAAFEALDARDWRALLAYVDPSALPSVKQQAISVAESVSGRTPSTPEEIQVQQPGLPFAVAEWYAEQERRAISAEEPAGITSLGLSSIEELQSLPDEEVFVRWMSATDPPERRRRMYAQLHGVTPEQAQSFPDPPPSKHVLGCVMEEGTAHVLYRVLEGLWPALQVESLRLTDRGWRLSADGIVAGSLRTYFRA